MHSHKAPFHFPDSSPLTAPTAADGRSPLALGLCVALTAFAGLFGSTVCVMCCVVLVSAGRNVLDSVPPTHRPPTHGVSASIPLALPAHHNLFAHLNPYPAFIPLLSLSLSLSPSLAFQERLPLAKTKPAHDCTLLTAHTPIRQAIKTVCIT